MTHPRDLVDRLNDQIPEFKTPHLVGAEWVIYFTGLQIVGGYVEGTWIAAKRGSDDAKIERQALMVYSVFGRKIYPEDLLTIDGYNEVKHKVLDTKDKLISSIRKDN